MTFSDFQISVKVDHLKPQTRVPMNFCEIPPKAPKELALPKPQASTKPKGTAAPEPRSEPRAAAIGSRTKEP